MTVDWNERGPLLQDRVAVQENLILELRGEVKQWKDAAEKLAVRMDAAAAILSTKAVKVIP